MQRRLATATFLLAFLSALAARAQPAQGAYHQFVGEVQAVDLKAKSFTLKSGGQRFVFHYTDQTKISGLYDYVRWDKVKPGQGAAVMMQLGPNNSGVTVAVRFLPNASFAETLSLFHARTTGGEVISGVVVSNYVAPAAERTVCPRGGRRAERGRRSPEAGHPP